MEKMATFAFEKLVRDKTEQRMQDPEVTLFKKQLSELEYKKELCKKLQEEVEEVVESNNKEELFNELADVLEVIHAFAKLNGQSIQDVEKVRKQRFDLRGGFYNRVYITTMKAPKNHKYSDYCRRAPKKYPQIG